MMVVFTMGGIYSEVEEKNLGRCGSKLKEEKKERLPLQSAYRLNRCDDLPFLGRRTSTAYGIVRLLNLLY